MGRLQWIHVTGPTADGIVCAQGAQVCDWTPAGHAPVLFLSGSSRLEAGQPIRGGIPVVFPWFGDDPEQRGRPAHGFARRLPWQVLATEEGPDAVRLALELRDSAATRELWPHGFALRVDASFGASLEVRLRIENPGPAPFRCETALHTYLAVGDVREVLVRGLERARYVDKLDGQRKVGGPEPLRIAGETDRIYAGTEAAVEVEDPVLGRTLRVAKAGARSTVVWNPWIDKAARLPDLGDDEWPVMLCVESGAIGDDRLELAPGASHTMELRIDCSAR